MSKVFGISKLPVTTIDSVLNGSTNKLPTPPSPIVLKYKNIDKFDYQNKNFIKIYTNFRNKFHNFVNGFKK